VLSGVWAALQQALGGWALVSLQVWALVAGGRWALLGERLLRRSPLAARSSSSLRSALAPS
jgi:hypothetical protein